MSMAGSRNIAVVGAGFSGTILVAHLLRRSQGGLHIHLINKSGRLARGVAYGTRSSGLLLNVPAGRMSAFAEDENDFPRFAQRRDPSIQGGTFVPRHLYGDYLRDPLIGNLLSRGLATCDASGLGIRVDNAYRVIGSAGTPSPVLSLTGPLLKGGKRPRCRSSVSTPRALPSV